MINVIDTETTGFEGSIVEVAVVKWPRPDAGFKYGARLVKPTCPIEYQAMAAHHLTEEMVANEPDLEYVLNDLYLNEPTDIFAAHNAEFDRKFFPVQIQERKWICTWRCALHLWPDAPSHSNQVLRYYLKLDVSDMPAEAGGNAHRALYDAWVTAKILERQINEIQHTIMSHDGPQCSTEQAIEHLIRMSTEPVLLRKCRFGKHRDELWKDIAAKDPGYLKWVLRQDDFDKDTMHTARHYLNA